MSGSKRELLLEDESGCVYWDSEMRCIEIEGKRFLSSARFRVNMEMVLKLIMEKHASRLLVDMSALDVFSPEDLVWTEKVWLPDALKSGLKNTAAVMPRSLALHMSLDKMTERIGSQMGSGGVFPDADSAREWLAKQ
jgi:hypothetical protein